MSAAQSRSAMEARLEALECHFTWDLSASRSRLFHIRDRLEDMGEEGYSWLGHAYNLQGFVQQRLGRPAEARRCLCRAAEAFRQLRNTVSDEGPWLLVNLGNLAWLHHLLGEAAESRRRLSELSALTAAYPSPCAGEPHPEVCAEKAWALMHFQQRRRAADFFQQAVRMQPDAVAWQTARVLASAGATATPSPDLLQRMKIARDHDPENLQLAAVYLEARAARGEEVEQEARALARRVLRRPAGSCGGIKPLLRLYRRFISIDEAIDLAEEALERHPGSRYVTRCAATCYRRRVCQQSGNHQQSLLDRAVSLCAAVAALYPQSALSARVHLAELHAHGGRAEAERLYGELLARDLEPEDAQMLYSSYAAFLQHGRSPAAVDFHMMAAAIPHPSPHRRDSIVFLRKLTEKGGSRRRAEVEEFLAQLET